MATKRSLGESTIREISETVAPGVKDNLVLALTKLLQGEVDLSSQASGLEVHFKVSGGVPRTPRL